MSFRKILLVLMLSAVLTVPGISLAVAETVDIQASADADSMSGTKDLCYGFYANAVVSCALTYPHDPVAYRSCVKDAQVELLICLLLIVD